MIFTLRKVVALCIATTLSLTGLYSNNNISNFCFDGDIPEAQSASALSCITSPVLICPSAYFGCPTDLTHPDITGYATASPGDPSCPDPIVTYSDEVIMNTACTVKIHRKWHAEYPPGTGNPWLYSECIQIIENIDDLAPVISAMPSDVTVTGNVANCTVAVSWSEPLITDNCLISSTSSSHTSGFAFPEGVTTVVYTAI
ncbi:MAG: HYR domain-containing protein, partial [Saprospiraceae bacterium]|nr:HYR domain-containing protein [Saprospiraceae bacterium]